MTYCTRLVKQHMGQFLGFVPSPWNSSVENDKRRREQGRKTAVLADSWHAHCTTQCRQSRPVSPPRDAAVASVSTPGWDSACWWATLFAPGTSVGRPLTGLLFQQFWAHAPWFSPGRGENGRRPAATAGWWTACGPSLLAQCLAMCRRATWSKH